MFEIKRVSGRDENGTTYDLDVVTEQEEDDAISEAVYWALKFRATHDVFRTNVARPASRIARVHPDGGIDFNA